MLPLDALHDAHGLLPGAAPRAVGHRTVVRLQREQFDPALLTAEPAGQNWLLTGINPELLAHAPAQPVAAPSADSPWMDAFMPDSVRSLAAQGEFRQVVTMFINLRELPDGAAGLELQHTLFRLLGQHGGYLCRIGQIGGDDPGATLLLFWGAPTSLENDLQRALDFGLDFQQQIGVPLRAGITNQLVYAGFVGADIREEYTCYGTAVNLAARLMVTAEWGEILLDAASAAQARAAFVCQAQGVRAFKGFDTPQPVWALIGQQRWRPTSYPRPLIGRERELSQLQDSLAPLQAGRAAGLAMVLGEAGIGKSRLVHELQQRLAWRVPLLQFAGTPLAEIVAAMNRHNRIQFMLTDPAIGGLQLSGTLRADKIAALRNMLEADFALETERRGNTIEVRRRR